MSKKIKASLLLFIPIFMLNIWILAISEPASKSMTVYFIYTVIASFGISYSTIMTIEYIKSKDFFSKN